MKVNKGKQFGVKAGIPCFRAFLSMEEMNAGLQENPGMILLFLIIFAMIRVIQGFDIRYCG